MPKEKLKLNLEKLKRILEKLQFKTKAYTGSLLSTEKGCKINIYLSGKIVIITRNEEQLIGLKEELSNILYTYTKTD
jgi:TATA-box binding protein (TBP) (component of TFIID and TFIIIB)